MNTPSLDAGRFVHLSISGDDIVADVIAREAVLRTLTE